MPISNSPAPLSESIRIRTLGAVAVVDTAGEPISGATSQRRPLALVAILAASHPHGMTRDKLMGLLWPDADSERAGHSLTQALYAARRALRVDDLFVTDGPISLNWRRISSDIRDVERELAAGNLESAAAAYAGPFLDGFYVSGAPELERWVSARRDELEERVVAALDRLAKTATDDRDLARAIRFRKQLSAVRPLDSTNATALVVLLGLAGRRADAIQSARVHTDLVATQLGLPPDDALVAAVDRLRDAAPPHRTVDAPRVSDEVRSVPDAALASVDEVPQIADAATGSGRAPRSSRRRTFAIAGMTLAAAVVTLSVVHRVTAYGAAPKRVARVQGSLLVAPFDISGAGDGTAYMGKAIVQLLAPRLVLDSTVHATDPGTTLAAWQRRGFESRASVPRDSALRFAADLGARQLVVGTVVGDRQRALLTASLITVPRGRIIAQTSVEGPAERIATLATELAAKLLVAQAGDSVRVAERWAHSFVALQRYTSGRLADHRGDPAAAAQWYEDAIALEPAFATAALRLAVAADRIGNADQEAKALATAWAHRDMLDDGERTLLMAFVGPRYPAPSPAVEQLDAWERIARNNERNPSMWQQLAANLFHEGARLGVATDEQAASALDRALELEASHGPADDLRNVMQDSSSVMPIAEDRLDDTTLSAVRSVAMVSLWRGRRIAAGAKAIDVLNERAATTNERIDAILAEHSLALNRGRSADAVAWAARLHEVKPDSHAHLRLQVLDALYGDGDRTAAANAVSQLSRQADSIFHDFPLARRRADADACVIGQWRLAHDDTSGVAAITRDLSSERVWREPARGTVSWGVCGQLLDAALAVATRRPDALHRVERLDALMFTPAVANNSAMYAHLLLSRLYERLGQPRRALAAVRKRDDMLGWPTYLAATLRQEWRLATVVGDVEGASLARQRYIACHGGDGP